MTFTTVISLVFLVVVFALYWGVKTRRAQDAILVIVDNTLSVILPVGISPNGTSPFVHLKT